jgi:hypothetical protein
MLRQGPRFAKIISAVPSARGLSPGITAGMPSRAAGLAFRRLGNSDGYCLDMPLVCPWVLQMEP